VSVKDGDKQRVLAIARQFEGLGFSIVATRGTAEFLRANKVSAELVKKIVDGRPNVIDKIKAKEIHLIINTPTGKGPMLDEAKIRSLAVSFGIPCITTLNAARAVIRGIEARMRHGFSVKTIQEYHSQIRGNREVERIHV
jgi:carbamoyl-phosphate synthase large subunit